MIAIRKNIPPNNGFKNVSAVTAPTQLVQSTLMLHTYGHRSG